MFDFSVTIVALPMDMTLGETTEFVQIHNDDVARVRDREWPGGVLARKWQAEYQGDPVNIQSGTGENCPVIITRPLIERPKRKDQWLDRNNEPVDFEDRINTFGKETLFFTHQDRTWCAVLASSASDDTKRIIRDLLLPFIPVDTTPIDYLASDDMFYWLLHVLMENGGRLTGMRLADVRGYFGETLGGHRIHGSGARITSHLSTLGVVAENEPLRAVEIQAQVGGDDVIFTMFDDGSCHIDDNSTCAFAQVPNAWDRQILLMVYVYTRVLPLLHAGYAEAVGNGAWNANERLNFTYRVADLVSNVARARIPRP